MLAAFAAAVKFLPTPIEGVSASPSVSNGNLEKEASDEKAPWITRVFARMMAGDATKWDERSEKHLALAMKAADTRLLYNEAELPPVYRLKNTSAWAQASPHANAVGADISMNGTVIKEDGTPDLTIKI